VGVAYTQLKQIEFYLPYTLFFGKGKYITVGDLWYYKYTYFFYGVGNSNPVDYSEKYGVNTPRLRLTILKKITNSLFLGFRSYIQSFNTYDLEPNGQLALGNIIGAKGNKTSSIGLATWYDTRDGIFFPRNGIFVDAHILKDSPAWGSDYIFTRALIDATHYLPIGNSSVLATNIVTSSIYGDAPFQELNFLGGPKKMRGYYLGHFRDKNMWLLQSEFRSLISPRLGYTLFADAGSIAPTYAELLSSRIRFTLGAGLRIVLNKSERMTARVDAGFGPHTSGVYVTVGEAF
jgi:outer membrane protein assembly factor BamA